MVRRVAALLVPALLLAVAVAVPAPARAGRYTAEVRRTAYGIPHISAKDHGSLGYGYGYAFAQDNLCVLASWVVTLRGERSRHFGAQAESDDPIAPTSNLASDLYYKGLRESGLVQRLAARPAPLGPTRELRALVDGYVAGYNRYLAEKGVAGLSDPACRGKAWVGPITALDIWTNLLDLSRTVGTTSFKEEIAEAFPAGEKPADTPGEKPADKPGDEPADTPGDKPAQASATRPHAPGSNAWALGRQATKDGHGMLLADPHYPWAGNRRFYQVQLTIPGELNVFGGSLYGTPVVQIGHNTGLAWTHTVSHAQRLTLFRLDLVPGDPTRYLVDGRAEPMGRQRVTVAVKDGQPVTRTLYTSRYGPVLGAGWTAKEAYALADANAANLRTANEWLAMSAADDVAGLRAAQATYQGMPFVYTLATDTGGTAYFADASVVPHVTDAHAARCREPGTDEPLVLDGAKSACAWGRDADAVQPGLFGPGRLPTLTRADYVANSNASPWLTNPSAPLTGYPRVFGDSGAPLDLRTRLSLTLIADRIAGTDGLGPAGFTLDTLTAAAGGKRNLSAELGRADVLAVCRAHPTMTAADGREVDVRQACATLAAWDGRAGLNSAGAVLWREFFTGPRPFPPPGGQDDGWWRIPFDPKRPVTTPRGFDRSDAGLRTTLATTVAWFQDNHVPLDLTPGQAQRFGSIAIPGCTEGEGCFDRIRTPGPLRSDGRYADVNAGSSFLMAVALTPAGPRTRTVLTYSLSADPTSSHHTDQTELFSRGQWVTARFSEAEIAADPELTKLTLRG